MSEPRSSRRADRNAAAPGRRAGDPGRRRVDVVVALAIALPALSAIGLALAGEHKEQVAGSLPPVSTGLTSATLTCPPALDKHAQHLLVARAPQAVGGQVTVRKADAAGRLSAGTSISVPTSKAASLDSARASVLDATGDSAPGLVAGRREPAAAASCGTPSYDEWYVGLGASATNDSVLTLTNPDAGQAVVDTELIGPRGPVAADRLRGMVVPGHGVLTVDLAKTIPTRLTLAAHVLVSRGRVGVAVAHRYDRLGSAPVVTDYLPAIDGASTEELLLGATVDGQSVSLANPGDNQARATIRVLDAQSVFTPTGTQPITVPPQSVVRVPLSKEVPGSAAKGMLGVVVESDQPLLASSRGMTGGDLGVVGTSPTITGPTAAIVPDGATRLVIAGATRTGVVNLTVSDAKGKVLIGSRSVAIGADRGTSVTLPKGAAVVTLDPRNTPVSASLVTLARRAISVVPIRNTVFTTEVPAVHPH